VRTVVRGRLGPQLISSTQLEKNNAWHKITKHYVIRESACPAMQVDLACV
jgi:hypothetical protein